MISYENVSTLYVSQQTGSDGNLGVSPVNDCVMNGPFRTIDRALKLVSDLRYAGHKQPITIAMLDEEYDFTRPFLLDVPQSFQHRTPALANDVTVIL